MFNAPKPNLLAGFKPRAEYSAPAIPAPRIVSNPAPRPAPPAAVPMDVDAARYRQRQALPSDVCHHCKKTGHWASNCPLKFDVRAMSVEELENELAMAKDRAELARRGESDDDADQDAEEDFGQASK